MNIVKDVPVAVHSCESYDTDEVYAVLCRCFADAGIGETQIKGKKVVIKPNLVMAKKPELAATSHPATVEACAKLLAELGAAKITLADSPGGPFSAPALSMVYKTCGMAPLEGTYGISLNSDCTFQNVFFKDGSSLKNFNIISAVEKADVLLNLCKLKTHSLTGMSCAVKNVFGVIPGVEKFEMHATFSTVDTFSAMLNDLNAYLLSEKTYLSVCDGIIGMEGNGPTHGVPKKAGLMLVSASPFALDIVAEHIIGCDGEVKYLDIAAERGYVSRDYREINAVGKKDYPVYQFQKPDNAAGKFLRNLPNFMGGRFAPLFEARPEIDTKKCVGCGICVRSCPKHTIALTNTKKGKKTAAITRTNCIKCYCCQELCPAGAVKTRQNPLIKLIH